MSKEKMRIIVFIFILMISSIAYADEFTDSINNGDEYMESSFGAFSNHIRNRQVGRAQAQYMRAIAIALRKNNEL